GPGAAGRDELRSEPDPFFAAVREGWAIAFERMPGAVGELLRSAPGVLTGRCAGLPRTLYHGDAKVANFALPPGRVAAFDWALVDRPAAADVTVSEPGCPATSPAVAGAWRGRRTARRSSPGSSPM